MKHIYPKSYDSISYIRKWNILPERQALPCVAPCEAHRAKRLYNAELGQTVDKVCCHVNHRKHRIPLYFNVAIENGPGHRKGDCKNENIKHLLAQKRPQTLLDMNGHNAEKKNVDECSNSEHIMLMFMGAGWAVCTRSLVRYIWWLLHRLLNDAVWTAEVI
jgi:hypothetical protein